MEFSGPEYWSGKPFPSPGDLPNPGIEPRSPALHADSLPAKPQGKTCELKTHRSYDLFYVVWNIPIVCCMKIPVVCCCVLGGDGHGVN